MQFKLADRVKESTITTGTGAVALGGAVVNFETFSANLSNGDTTYYAIVDNTNNMTNNIFVNFIFVLYVCLLYVYVFIYNKNTIYFLFK